MNIGDSGFVVIRDGKIEYKSREQQRGFNHPFQLGKSADKPSLAEVCDILFRDISVDLNINLK